MPILTGQAGFLYQYYRPISPFDTDPPTLPVVPPPLPLEHK